MLASDYSKAKNLSNQLKGLGYKSKVAARQPIKVSNLDFLKSLGKAAKKTYKKSVPSPYKVVEKDVLDPNVVKAQEAARIASKAADIIAEALYNMEALTERVKDSESRSKSLASSVLNSKVSIERIIEEAGRVEVTPEVVAVQPVAIELTTDMVNEDIVRHIVRLMHNLPEKDKLEVSQGIRNAQSFIYKGTKYQTSELMHGGGSASSGGGFTVLPATGVINSANTVFTFTEVPDFVVSDGVWFPPVAANGTVFWTNVGNVVTMVNPPTFDIYGIAN